MNLSMFVFVATGQPHLLLAAEARLAKEIDAGHDRLEEFQSFSVGNKNGKQHVLAEFKIDRKNSASQALFE